MIIELRQESLGIDVKWNTHKKGAVEEKKGR